MISSYNSETRVYTCHFTREEYDALVILVTSGVCGYHGSQCMRSIEELRILRDELLEGEV